VSIPNYEYWPAKTLINPYLPDFIIKKIGVPIKALSVNDAPVNPVGLRYPTGSNRTSTLASIRIRQQLRLTTQPGGHRQGFDKLSLTAQSGRSVQALPRPLGRGKQSCKPGGFSPKEGIKVITLQVSEDEFAISAAGGQAGFKHQEIVFDTSTTS